MLGHEGCGHRQAVGKKVRNFKPGDRVIGGLVFDFSDPRYASAAGAASANTRSSTITTQWSADGVADAAHGWFECYEIQRQVDADIPPAEAALLCTWREVYGGFGDFSLKAGDEILVFGAGPVGLSFVKFGKLLGLKWIGVVDPLENKRQRAQAFGADAVFTPADVADLTKKRAKSLDAVVDAVGNRQNHQPGAPADQIGRLDLRVWRDQRCQPDSEQGHRPVQLQPLRPPMAHPLARARGPATALQLDSPGKLKAAEFVTHEFPVAQITDALAAVKSGQVVKCLLQY